MFKKTEQVKWRNRTVLIATVVFILVLIALLIYPNPLGLADNHDYWRLMTPFGLEYKADESNNFFSFVSLDYLKLDHSRAEVLSSGLVFVAMSYFFSTLLQCTTFSLLLLGLVHVLAYGMGYFLLLKHSVIKDWRHLLLFALISLMLLSDLLFSSYFNSFYQESAFFICLLLFCSLFQKDKSKFFWWELLLLALIVVSKVSQSIFLLFLIPLLWKYRKQSGWTVKKVAVLAVIPLLVWLQMMNQGKSESPNVFNSFFDGLITVDNASTVLADFALTDSHYPHFVGADFWQVKDFDAELKKDFFAKVSHAKIALYYFNHPMVFTEKMVAAFRLLEVDSRPKNLGNRLANYSPSPMIEMGIMSTWQKMLPFLIWLGLFLSWLQLWYICRVKAKSALAVLLIMFTVILPLQLITTFIGDGWQEFAKHNVSFYFVFTLAVLLSIQFWYKQLVTKSA